MKAGLRMGSAGDHIFGSGIPRGEESARPEAAHDSHPVSAAAEADAGSAPFHDGRESIMKSVLDFRQASLKPFSEFVFGNQFATVVAIKSGESDDAFERGFLDGPDGQALEKALDAMGYPKGCVLGIQLGAESEKAGIRGLRPLIELVDPKVLVALDDKAGQVLLGSYAKDEISDVKLNKDGTESSAKWICGRKAVLLHDFQNDLGGVEDKRRAWAVLKELAQ